MYIDTDNLINSILNNLDEISYVDSDDVPNIDLYVDQVTTFMDRMLRPGARNTEDDKILTKTMINNYAKNNLLPAPEKKKYNKEHIFVLIFIYYFKNVLSINDIQMILNPLTQRYYGNSPELSLEKIYDEVRKLAQNETKKLKKDISDKYDETVKLFENEKSEDKEFLQMFSLICTMIIDIYTKKRIIESMLDDYTAKHAPEESKKDSDKKVKK